MCILFYIQKVRLILGHTVYSWLSNPIFEIVMKYKTLHLFFIRANVVDIATIPMSRNWTI